ARSLIVASSTASYTTEATIEATSTDFGTRTPTSTAKVGGVWYVAWWDDASSGTIKVATKTASGGTAWAAETDFATSVTRLVEIVPVDSGQYLMVVYQSGSNVVMDWIVAPPAGVTVNGGHATASAAAFAG